MKARMPGLRLALLQGLMLGLMIGLSVALSGCDTVEQYVCNPLSETSATVLIEGEANIALPAPVTLEGVTIGRVRSKALDAEQRPILTLCLDSEQAKRLDRITVFYIDQGASGQDELVCVTFPDEKSPASEQMRFLGFPSYPEFLAWRAQGIVKKGVDGFLEALDDAFDNVTK